MPVAECTQQEDIDKSICMRLGHIINAFHELLQTAMTPGTCIELLLKELNKLYAVLTILVKWVSFNRFSIVVS